ncbi:Uncharacterized protein LSUE1_G010013 [Lachnellula suecica]|uniref:Pyridine nucleotide-disulphide oxidoreductase N-terminal domain-containing protein n=1 Tax=Lachnellula suecica TaxID=602035 RepID=A0A8T9BVP1_9HELO|nr:Uncharacterized protein LSUE1_G010013 [Lachnellula suecica]
MAPLKVLIIGGGVAGPALAHWLSHIQANITLIERSPSMRASGQQVDLRGQGVAMMKKMGIEEAVRAASVQESGTQLVDIHGRTKAFFPAVKSGKNRQNVKHLFNTTVESLTQDEFESNPNGKVHVRFQDGRQEDFDLVVGADGTGSKTRKMMLGPDAPDPRHSKGGYIGFFSIPANPQDSDRFTMCFLPGPRVSRMIGTRKNCPELTQIYMIMRGKDKVLEAAHKSGSLAELKKAWGDLYQGGGWECDRFMEALGQSPEADDLYCTPFVEVQLPTGSWSKGRVVLIGDAAHSGTADGYGSTWGLVGAYILAGEIATRLGKDELPMTAAVVEGADSYEEIFRPIATANHGGSEWFENISNPRSSFGIGVFYAFARVAAYFRLDQMAGFDGKTAKWQLPEYPELEIEQH